MASDKGFAEFIMETCGVLDARAMMGEYVFYYCGKVVGGVYDNRFLVKNVPSARALMPDAALALPYEGGSEMLLVEDVEDGEFLRKLFKAMYDELPEPKKKRRDRI